MHYNDVQPFIYSEDLNEPPVADVKGRRLLDALLKRATEKKQTLRDLATELGVTYGYINQLRTGVRNVSQISDAFASSCAQYLGLSRFAVLMLAERITPEDFFTEPGTASTELSRALSFIRNDPAWGHFVPDSLLTADVASQYLVVKLYEKATRHKLLSAQAPFLD